MAAFAGLLGVGVLAWPAHASTGAGTAIGLMTFGPIDEGTGCCVGGTIRLTLDGGLGAFAGEVTIAPAPYALGTPTQVNAVRVDTPVFLNQGPVSGAGAAGSLTGLCGLPGSVGQQTNLGALAANYSFYRLHYLCSVSVNGGPPDSLTIDATLAPYNNPLIDVSQTPAPVPGGSVGDVVGSFTAS